MKHTLKHTDDQGIRQCMETTVPIINSKVKEEAFLHFLHKLSRTQELMQWIDGATLLSKFQLHLQGSYQTDWNELLEATDPNEDRDVNYFDEQVQNFLYNLFAEDEWSSMAHYIQTCCYKLTLVTTNQL
jgi:hypothetical protein